MHEDLTYCELGLQAHHVIPQQKLRRNRPEALWNPLSGMLVCGLAHRQHHNRVRPILFHEIPPAVIEYLTELGFGWYLERHYPAAGASERGGQT